MNAVQQLEQVQTALVVDTNFVISNLNIVKDLHSLCDKYGHSIIIPWVVIQELDKLKSSNSVNSVKHSNNEGVDFKARAGINWIFMRFAESDPHVIGQKMTETVVKCDNNDDAILDCCIYFQQHYNAFTVILSNDKNLCSKALIHKIKTVSFVDNMTAETIAETVFNAAIQTTSYEQSNCHVDNDAMELDESYSNDNDIQSELNLQNPKVSSSKFSENNGKDKNSVIGNDNSESLASKSFKDLEKCSDYETLRDYVEDDLLNHIREAIDYQMRAAYDNDTRELEYFGYSKKNLDNFMAIRDTLKRYTVSVFSPFLSRSLYDKVKSSQVFAISKREFLDFIDLWGSVWINLANKQEEGFARDRVEKYKILLNRIKDV